jgi:hypothetical protein
LESVVDVKIEDDTRGVTDFSTGGGCSCVVMTNTSLFEYENDFPIGGEGSGASVKDIVALFCNVEDVEGPPLYLIEFENEVGLLESKNNAGSIEEILCIACSCSRYVVLSVYVLLYLSLLSTFLWKDLTNIWLL